MRLERCPRELIGAGFINAVNLASISGSGDWPALGGLMDQAAWFLNLYQRLKSETGRIDREKIEKAKRGS